MTVSNEKGLWEAFRNREATIVVEGEAEKKVLFCRLIRIVGLLCGIFLGFMGFAFIIFGAMCSSAMNSIGGNSGNSFLAVTLIPAAMFWCFSAALIILVWLGKGHKLLAQLRNYRIVRNEGVTTLTRK